MIARRALFVAELSSMITRYLDVFTVTVVIFPASWTTRVAIQARCCLNKACCEKQADCGEEYFHCATNFQFKIVPSLTLLKRYSRWIGWVCSSISRKASGGLSHFTGLIYRVPCTNRVTVIMMQKSRNKWSGWSPVYGSADLLFGSSWDKIMWALNSKGHKQSWEARRWRRVLFFSDEDRERVLRKGRGTRI
jgi:hypothetical protein